MTDGRTSRLTDPNLDVRLVVGYVPAARRVLAVVGVVGLIGTFSLILTGAQTGAQDRAVTQAWHRAVDAEPGVVHVFERGDAGQSNLHPTSMTAGAKPLVVGERVMVVTPDGAIHTLRVCDPASASASIAPDCLNAFVARAVPPATTPVPQRSL